MRIIEGVGLILFDQDGRILMFSTSRVKTECSQNDGMLSVPIRIIEDGESDVEALVRLILEDLGNETIQVSPEPHGTFAHKLSDAVTEKLWLFIGKCDLSFDIRSDLHDCIFYGWMPPQALMNRQPGQLRPGIESIVDSCFAH
jgi:hypothetical protein